MTGYFGWYWEECSAKRAESYQHGISDAMFCAHMVKHFMVGGCGIRAFLDLWILNHRVGHDREKREALLGEGGLLTFAHRAEKLSEVWFGQEEHDATSRELSDYILEAGIYGDRENMVAVSQMKVGNNLRYWVTHRIFAPYNVLKAEYPVLEKNKWLTPIYQVVRWVRKLLSGRLKYFWKDWNIKSSNTEEKSLKIAELLKNLDIL